MDYVDLVEEIEHVLTNGTMDGRAKRRERLLQKSEARMNALLGKNKEQNSSSKSRDTTIHDDNRSTVFMQDSKEENRVGKIGLQQINIQENGKSINHPEIRNGEHIECDVNCSVNKMTIDENNQQNRKINETKSNEQEQGTTEKENIGGNEVVTNNCSFLSDFNFVEQGQTFWHLINLGMGILNFNCSNDQTKTKTKTKHIEETIKGPDIYINSLKKNQITFLIIISFCFNLLKYKYIYNIHDDGNDATFIPFLKYATHNKIRHLLNSPLFFICFSCIYNIIVLLTRTFYKCFTNKNWTHNWKEQFKCFHRSPNVDEQNWGILIWTLQSVSSMLPILLHVTKSFVFSIFFIFLFDDIFYNTYVSVSK